jgi:hypothetical protein
MLNNKGVTTKVLNPLILSDSEAKTVSEGFAAEFGDPVYEMTLQWPYLDVMRDINDQGMVWAKNIFTDDLFIINSFTYIINNLSDSANFRLEDTGRNFTDQGNIVYNRNLYDTENANLPNVIFDGGFVYDMSVGVDGTPPPSSKYKNNLGFQ